MKRSSKLLVFSRIKEQCKERKSSAENVSWQTMPKLPNYSMDLTRKTRSEKQMSSFGYGEELKRYTIMNRKTNQTKLYQTTTRATYGLYFLNKYGILT